MSKIAILASIVFLTMACTERVRVIETQPGVNGNSCTVVEDSAGATITCTDGTSATVSNGQDGTQGPKGDQGEQGPQGEIGPQGPQGIPGPVEGSSIVEMIDPCGASSTPDEVLLKLSNGSLLAWYLDLGLVELEDGRFRTTDAQQCHFDVIAGDVVERGSPTNKNGVRTFSRELTGSTPSNGVQLTCLADTSVLLNASQVRVRSAITQNVEVRQTNSNKVTVLVEAGRETIVTFDSRGTVTAVPQSQGSQQTKACNN